MSLATSTTASVPMPRELRADLVLVVLPPRERAETPGGIVLLPAESIVVDQLGIVAQIGARVTDVVPGDRVVFSGRAGEELLVDGMSCLLLRAQDIEAVLED